MNCCLLSLIICCLYLMCLIVRYHLYKVCIVFVKIMFYVMLLPSVGGTTINSLSDPWVNKMLAGVSEICYARLRRG